MQKLIPIDAYGYIQSTWINVGEIGAFFLNGLQQIEVYMTSGKAFQVGIPITPGSRITPASLPDFLATVSPHLGKDLIRIGEKYFNATALSSFERSANNNGTTTIRIRGGLYTQVCPCQPDEVAAALASGVDDVQSTKQLTPPPAARGTRAIPSPVFAPNPAA